MSNNTVNNDRDLFDIFKDGPDVPEQYYFSVSTLESLGFKIGEMWAGNQNEDDLLFCFQEFFEDWIKDDLSKERYELLYAELDPSSIVAAFSDTLNQLLDDPYMAEAMLENYLIFEKGIVRGVMSIVKDIII